MTLFLLKIHMVRMVHTNHCDEISLQLSDPKIKFLMKICSSENGQVHIFRNKLSGKQKPLRGARQQKKQFKDNIPGESTNFDVEITVLI